MALTDVAVLLVEDDPVFRQLVADFLVAQGALVNIADNGEQGIKLFTHHHFDIVVADLCMPVIGGLDMLKQMVDINASIPSIVISGNDAMADVVEALRIGASDYLVKPVTDLFMIEQSIEQALLTAIKPVEHVIAPQTTELIELSYQELNDNLQLLEQSSEAAKSVQQQLFPSSTIEYPQALIHYTLYKNNDVSAYFIDSTMVGNEHLVLYMAHFMPEDNSAAFGCVLLRSFVDQQLKSFRNGQNKILIHPAQMLEYLNERLANSGLHILMDIIYVCLNMSDYHIGIAQSGKGLRCYLRNSSGLTPLAIAGCEPIGFPTWRKPSIQSRHLSIGEKLCLGTHEPEHKQALLENQFEGLIFDNKIKAGGFMQLECG